MRHRLFINILLAVTLVWGLGQPVASFTGQTVPPDQYEPDDTPAQAKVIVINDVPQHHNFDHPGDQDWVKFYGAMGEVYTIKTSNLGSNCDTVIELYDSDGATLLRKVDNGGPGEPETLEWTCPKESLYYVRVYDADPRAFEYGTQYDLAVYRPTAPGTGTIIGTVLDGDTGQGIDGVDVISSVGATAISVEGAYFMILPAGKCQISLKHPNYTTVTVNDVYINTGQQVPLSLTMKPLVSSVIDGIWRTASGPVIYFQTYVDNSAVCIVSSDGKNIIAAYDDNLANSVFDGFDLGSGGKKYRLTIKFTSTSQGNFTLTDLVSGKPQTWAVTKDSTETAQPGVACDGIWSSNPDDGQRFYLQQYKNGGALMLRSNDALTCEVFYDPAPTTAKFKGSDIYNPHQAYIEFTFIGPDNGAAVRTPVNAPGQAWTVIKFSAAK
ncbi:MAG: carboxypeptidase regulatory-like domain-containing protein [Deltaproteobacteria bacterium]|nr:carboxypeptidase regulatory-like domain-containing protein [Deltaproteobacteria bacterium]